MNIGNELDTPVGIDAAGKKSLAPISAQKCIMTPARGPQLSLINNRRYDVFRTEPARGDRGPYFLDVTTAALPESPAFSRKRLHRSCIFLQRERLSS